MTPNNEQHIIYMYSSDKYNNRMKGLYIFRDYVWIMILVFINNFLQ